MHIRIPPRRGLSIVFDGGPRYLNERQPLFSGKEVGDWGLDRCQDPSDNNCSVCGIRNSGKD